MTTDESRRRNQINKDSVINVEAPGAIRNSYAATCVRTRRWRSVTALRSDRLNPTWEPRCDAIVEATRA